MPRPGSIRNDRGHVSLWRVPNYLLEPRGHYLGGERDEKIVSLMRWRNIVGVVAALALLVLSPAYRAGQKSDWTEVVNGKQVPVTGVEKYVSIWVDSVAEATLLSIGLTVVFGAVIVALTYPGYRARALRYVSWPLLTLLVYVGSIAVAVLGARLIYHDELPWSKSQSTPVHVGSYLVFVLLVIVLLVWGVRATILVVAGTFRAADAHPLAIPLISTVVVWALAVANTFDGLPAGVPIGLALLVLLLGPLSVTAVNAAACRRLHVRYGTMLFRYGPPGRT